MKKKDPVASEKSNEGTSSSQRGNENRTAISSTRTDPVSALQHAVGNQEVQALHERGELFGHGESETSPADQSSTGGSRSVQFKEDSPESADRIRDTAAEGVRGSGEPLPHLDRLQSSFPDHDLSTISAHTDQTARKANEEIGSKAYATGTHIAFRDTPDLETTAHEVTHVLQQREGIQLDDGVGSPDDRYEQEADDVARRVVRGDEPAVADGTESSPPDRGRYVQLQEDEQAPAGINPDEDVYDITLPALEQVVFTIPESVPVVGGREVRTIDGLLTFLNFVPITMAYATLINGAKQFAQATDTTTALGTSGDLSWIIGEGGAGTGLAFGPNGEIAVYGTAGGGISLPDNLLDLGDEEFWDIVKPDLNATADATWIWGGLDDFSGPAAAVGASAFLEYGGEVKFIVDPELLWSREALLGGAVGVGVGVGGGIALAGRVDRTWTGIVADDAGGEVQEDTGRALDEETGEVVDDRYVNVTVIPEQEPEEEEEEETSAEEESIRTPPSGPPVVRYEVVEGDTLSGIAERFAVSGGWQRLYHDIEDNKREIGPDPDLIHPGDTIWIPVESSNMMALMTNW